MKFKVKTMTSIATEYFKEMLEDLREYGVTKTEVEKTPNGEFIITVDREEWLASYENAAYPNMAELIDAKLAELLESELNDQVWDASEQHFYVSFVEEAEKKC